MKHLYFCKFTTLFIVFLLTIPSLATPSYQDLLSPGSSISVEDNSNMLVSSNLLFSCGFYKVGVNAFTFAVWVNQSIDQAVVWTANQDSPVNGRGSKIELWRDGTMVLLDFNRKLVWSTGMTSRGARGARLLDTGNLVLLGPDGNFLWQSFDRPTDTLLPTQPITANTRLGSGNYMLSFDRGNGLALTYNTPEGRPTKYWPKNTSRTQFGGGQPRALTMFGCFSASDQVIEYCASDKGDGILRRLILDYDGNLRIYSLSETSGSWSISWMALAGACEVHGLCGNNGICSYGQNPICSCPPGFVSADPSDWTKGCTPTFDLSCDKVAQMHFVNIGHMSFWGNFSNYTVATTLDDCMKSCSDDLHCEAFAYQVGLGACKLKGSVYSGGFAPSEFSLAFLKLPADAAVQYGVGHQPCNPHPSWQRIFSYPPEPAKGFQWNYLYMPVGSVFAVEAILLPIAWCFLLKRKRESSSRDDGFALINSHFRKFTFKELVRGYVLLESSRMR